MPRAELDLSVSKIHHWRYLRHRAGMTLEQIAKQDKVNEATVKRSLEVIDAYRQANTVEALNENVVSGLRRNHEKVHDAIGRGLDATLDDGKPDHAIQLQAVDSYTDLVNAVQPKGGKGIAIQTNVGIPAAQSVHSESRVAVYEDRLREIRKKMEVEHRAALLPAPQEQIADADVSDDEEEGDVNCEEEPGS